MLLARGASASATDLDGSTPLHNITGRVEDNRALQLLLDAGADINAVRKSDGATPLLTATRKHQLINLTFFRDANADFDRQDLEGKTALHYACGSQFMEGEHADIWLSLANPTIRDYAGRTAASYLAGGPYVGQGRADVIPKIVKLGLSLESQDCLGRTLLLQFLARDYLNGCELFVKNAAEPWC